MHAPDDFVPAVVPRRFRVVRRTRETHDTVSLDLVAQSGGPLHFEPGQFTMLSAFGGDEVPVSISGDPAHPDVLRHTVRDVGNATRALTATAVGETVLVRGPYGTGWGVADAAGRDLVVVAGGIGLAPLRPAVLAAVADPDRYPRLVVLYGARNPRELLYGEQLAEWAHRPGVSTEVIVDAAGPEWPGRVGLVTRLVDQAGFDADRATALVCGPEVMMRHTADALVARGVAPHRVRLSLERNMKCGVGLCGHCQLRGVFVCTDGPVFDYARVEPLLRVREL